jgi:hypothetical protein
MTDFYPLLAQIEVGFGVTSSHSRRFRGDQAKAGPVRISLLSRVREIRSPENLRSSCCSRPSTIPQRVQRAFVVTLDAISYEQGVNRRPTWTPGETVITLKRFSRKRGGYGWTPIEHARNKQFRFCFNDLVNNRGGVQVGRRFTCEPTSAWSPAMSVCWSSGVVNGAC